jgi:hypothetical protein
MEQIPSWEADKSQLVKKFPVFYGTRRFITAFTSARQINQDYVPPVPLFVDLT